MSLKIPPISRLGSLRRPGKPVASPQEPATLMNLVRFKRLGNPNGLPCFVASDTVASTVVVGSKAKLIRVQGPRMQDWRRAIAFVRVS
jgi:hypothetical protein